ncbi:MAG: hypothetical protein Q4B16_08490 [Bacteroidia bacterium]|nr:hypothetical protein [Bacteroidia bacterium]
MKALPSIAFNEFSGSAKDVTARVSKGRQVLSSRCMHSHVKTGAQASSRNRFSGISRAYRKLSSAQMAEWATLAEHMKGISTFGDAAKMTAHNAFVRINTNRALAGMPALSTAPVYTSDVPEVDYDDFWVTPERIVFVGLNQPSEHHRLVMKMSRTESTGVSSGWGNTVIVAPAFSPDWGDADITQCYLSTIGFLPVAGQKYFLSFWWMDTETGFTGESMAVSVICQELSAVRKAIYTPRNELTLDNISELSSGATVDRFYIEQAPGSALVMMDTHSVNTSYISGISGKFKDVPDSYLAGRVYFPVRGNGRSKWAIGLYELFIYKAKTYTEWSLSGRYGTYDPDFSVFSTSAMVNF